MRHLLTWLFGATFPFVVVACGLSSDSASQSNQPCTNEATAEAVRVSNTGEPGDFRLPDDEIECRLRRALLTSRDVPSNWQESRLLSGSAGNHIYGGLLSADCSLSYPSFRGGLQISFDYEGSESLSFVAHQIVALDEGDAARLMSALRHSCSQSTEEGYPNRVIDARDLGDDSILVETSSSIDEDDPFVMRTSFVRRGDVISQISFAPPGRLDEESISSRIAKRLGDIGALPEPEVRPGEGCAGAEDLTGNGARAAKGLLAQSDVPRGWVEDPPGPCGFINYSTDCREAILGLEPAEYAVTAFTGYDRRVGHSVQLFAADKAEQLIAEIRRRVSAEGARCNASIDDASFVWRFRLVEHNLGEDLLVWGMVTEGAPRGESSWLIAMIHRDDAISTVQYGLHLGFGVSLDDLRFESELIRSQAAPFIEAARNKLIAVSN